MKMLPKAPGSLIYKALRTKQIKVNNLRAAEAGTKLMVDDTGSVLLFRRKTCGIGIPLNRTPSLKVCSRRFKFRYSMRMKQILILNKPAGVLSQKDTPESYSLSEYLLESLEPEGGWRGTFRPGLCNAAAGPGNLRNCRSRRNPGSASVSNGIHPGARE